MNTQANELASNSVAYQVVDIQTKAVVKEYPAGKGQVARNFASKRDMQYGAVRFIVRIV